MNIAVDGDRAFVRTFYTAGKSKRIRKNSIVEIAPSTTIRGKPTGSAIHAHARVFDGSESDHASQAINRKHAFLMESSSRLLIASGVIKPCISRLRPFAFDRNLKLVEA